MSFSYYSKELHIPRIAAERGLFFVDNIDTLFKLC